MGFAGMFAALDTGKYGASAKERAIAEGDTRDRNARAEAVFYDTEGSDEVKKRLNERMEALASQKAPQVTAEKFGPSAFIGASSVGPAATYGGAKIDRAHELESRGAQLAAMTRARDAAEGKGPSIAGIQMGAAVDQSLAARMAAAGAGPRSGSALTAYGAGKGMSATLGQGIATSAATRAGEAMEGAQQFGGLSSAVRGADLSAAGAQAKFDQEAAMFSAGAKNAAKFADAGFAQQSAMFNASQSQKEAELAQRAELANVEATLRARGMSDQAIASYLSAYQRQFNLDKSNKMGFWEYAQGNDQFTQSMQDKRQAAETASDAAFAGGFADMVTMGMGGGGAKKG